MKKKGRIPKWELIKDNLDVIKEWSEQGATEKQIATELLHISYSTFNKYKAEKKELMEALKKGRDNLVKELRGTLIKKALGFSYSEKKSYKKNDSNGDIIEYEEEVIKYALPDVAALNLALKNYDSENWSNDPAFYKLKVEELEIRKKATEKNDW